MRTTTRPRSVSLLIWRSLCLLAVIPGLLACSPWWVRLPDLWRGILCGPGLFVALVLVVAWFADSSRRCDGRPADG